MTRCGMFGLICTLVLVTAAGAEIPKAAGRASIRDATGPTLTLLPLDASTAQSLRQADLTVSSDNGIRCIRAPCPTDSRQWRGRTDDGGRADLPRDLVRVTAHVDAGALTGDLIEDSWAAEGNVWVVELLPRAAAADALPSRAFKLMDARSGRAIGDRPVRVEYRLRTGALPHLDLRSNPLGYVFLPAQIPAGAGHATWVDVAGYRRIRLDYSWAQHRLSLVPK